MDKIKDGKVLIVDDSKLMRLLLNNIIDSMKYFSEIYEAENGREALDLLELKKVDLILLDIEMPVMDGVEALKEIRLKHDAKVIIVSSLAQLGSSYSVKVKQLSADGVIDKPSGAVDPSLAAKRGNELRDMIKSKPKSNGKIEIDLTGPQGNAYYILGVAKNLCRQVGIPFKPLMDEMTSGDYENLIKVFDDKFGSFVTMYR